MIRPQIIRQALIISGVVMSSVSDGFIFGQMSGMVANLQSKDSDIPLSESDISWIAATINVTCICGFAVATLVTEKCGRRRVVTILTTPIIAVWIMLYYAHSMAVFMISRVIVGIGFGGVFAMCIVITGEYIAPSVRGLCLNMVTSVGISIGTMLGHVLSLFFHWRTVALIGIIPTGLSALLPCFWVESPPWLASKRKFKESEAAFRALHSHRENAEIELEQLLFNTGKYNKENTSAKNSYAFIVMKLKRDITQRHFWRLALLVTAINVYRAAASKILFSTLAITMLQEMTGSSDILLFTLLVDGFAVLGACLSCFFISRMKMRTLLFSSACIANVFLVALSACMYFSSGGNVYMPWINCTLLALYFITVNAGPYPVLEALFGEIYPLDLKTVWLFMAGVESSILQFLCLKFASNLFTILGYHGVFLLYAIVMCLCLVYFWVQMPETKGRTLQEIEFYIKNNTFDKVNDAKYEDESQMECL